jgi:hypothetical protein
MRPVNLFTCVTALAAAGAGALTDSDILHRLEALEAKNTKMEAENTEIKAENAEIKAENAEITATLNATTAGELKMFNAEECPPGWVEFNKTQGYLLTGRPKGGETGTTINRPMDVGEEGRSPEHSHEVGVTDLGHTHTMVVNDPGHNHGSNVETNDCHCYTASGNNGVAYNEQPPHWMPIQTKVNKTGIVVDALPTKSNIQVSLTSNEDGEGYPLVYVLICQRALEE